jgi:hypothetical protein
MNFLKNFFLGLFVVIVSFFIFLIITFTWPVIIGLSSLILSFLAGVLFVALFIYLISLVGQLVRTIVFRKD